MKRRQVYIILGAVFSIIAFVCTSIWMLTEFKSRVSQLVISSSGVAISRTEPANGSAVGLPSPSPREPSSNALDGAVDHALSILQTGSVVFNTPDRMHIGRTQIVQANLGIHVPSSALDIPLSVSGTRNESKLNVSPKMQAMLTGGGAFDISPSGEQVQFVASNSVNSWQWEVTPKLEGPQVLNLTFDVFISVDGEQGTHTIKSLQQTINVTVGWPKTFGQWAEFVKNGIQYVGWAWAAIIAFIVWTGRWLLPARLRKKFNIDKLTAKTPTKSE